MTCDECSYFQIIYEPLRSGGVFWDMGCAICKKHDMICDFASHRKFRKLDTCDDFTLREL